MCLAFDAVAVWNRCLDQIGLHEDGVMAIDTGAIPEHFTRKSTDLSVNMMNVFVCKYRQLQLDSEAT